MLWSENVETFPPSCFIRIRWKLSAFTLSRVTDLKSISHSLWLWERTTISGYPAFRDEIFSRSVLGLPCLRCWRVITISWLFFFIGFPRIVAFYPLSRKTRGRDISSSQNPEGKLHNVRSAPGPDGLPDGSYYFYGTKTSYIDFPNNGKLDSRYSLTLLAWVYPEGSGPIFHFAPGGVRFWVVRPNTLFVRFVRRTGRPTQQLISRTLIPKQWNYVGASYDEKTGIATLWRNSQPVKSVFIGRIRLATNRPVRMGALPRDLRYFRGRISCMQVYSVPLSGPEIKRAERVCFRGRE